jgi:hypothetical protein
MLGNQEIRADEQENDLGDVCLGLHCTMVVRFALAFHEDSLLYLERAHQDGSTPTFLVQQQ